MMLNEINDRPSVKKYSELDCAIAIINFFVDERWEGKCYDLSDKSLSILKQQVNYLKDSMENNLIPENKIEIAKQALENGIDIIETSSIMVCHAF